MRKLILFISLAFILFSCKESEELFFFDNQSASIETEQVLTLKSTSVSLNDGLVAYYPFNGNANDESGNDNNGIINGATLTSGKLGNLNCAYYFDGIDDNIIIPDYSNMSPKEAVSIVCWVKADSNKKEFQFIYDRVESNDGYGLTVTENGEARLTINGGISSVASKTIIIDDNWHFVVGTYSRSKNKLLMYIDGIKEDSAIYDSYITYNPEPRNNIGSAYGSGKNLYYNGSIDELRIYNRALTFEEIEELAKLKKEIEVDIDIKPGSIDNPINLKNNGVIPVAILSTQDFNVEILNNINITFGPNNAIEYHDKQHFKDIDNDGDIDMILHYNTQEAGISKTDESACISAELQDGTIITGCDIITVK